MSEHITHTLFALDCELLLHRFARDMPATLDALRSHPAAFRSGAICSEGRWHSITLAQAVRGAESEQAAAADLAFLVGLRTHDAADRQFKTIYRTLETDYLLTPERDGPSQISIEQDLFLLRLRGSQSAGGPFADALFEEHQGADLNLLADLLSDGAARDLLRLSHPSGGDDPGHVFGSREVFYVDVDRYLAAWSQPAVVADRVAEHRLYDQAEPLMQTLARLQSGEEVADDALEESLAALPTRCHYTRAVARFMADMDALQRYLANTISDDDLAAAFQIETPHITDAVEQSVGNSLEESRLLSEWHEAGS